MTKAELIELMRKIPDDIGSANVLYVATGSTMDMMSQRIWGRGELTTGGKIAYNGPTTRGIYIYAPPWPRKGNGKGKTGNKIKGTWAPSYIAGKKLVGRGDLPFELVGTLRKEWLGGVAPRPTKVTPYRCVISVSEKTSKKIEGLTKTKGAFVKLTEEERAAHQQHVLEAYTELVLNAR
jgi:hypothetical protein